MKTILLTLVIAFSVSCGDYYECTEENSCKDDSEEKAEPNSESSDEKVKWTLAEIQDHRYLCEDDFYSIVEDEINFCKCLVEKVSVRWEREDFLRHEYSYIKRLSKNGSVQRCKEPAIEWPEETEEEIQEDSEFDPESDPAEINGPEVIEETE